jgi:hypothetical protein
VNPTPRAAAFLVAVATAFVLAQTASAAELGLSLEVEDGTLAASAEVATPVADVSVQTAAAPVPAAASASVAVETEPVAARVDVAATSPAASGPPSARPGPGAGAKDPEARTPRPQDHGDRAGIPRDRAVVATASSEAAAPRLDLPAPLTTRAVENGLTSPGDLAPLPERSAGGWGASLQAAAAGISGSPAALVSLLLVVLALVLQTAPNAVGAPRPALLSFLLQRPG